MTNEDHAALSYADERIEVLRENYELSADMEQDLKEAYYDYYIEERDGNPETVNQTMERVAELYAEIVQG